MNKFDVVIIGSGLGGLETAYILSKEGYSVCVLEQGEQYGGVLQNFARDGVVFDTGAHYIGSYDEGQSLYQYFKYFNLTDKLRVKKLDSGVFDAISFDDDDVEYMHRSGFESFKQGLIKDFPQETASIQQYVNDISEIGNAFPLFTLKGDSNGHYADRQLRRGVYEYLNKLTENEGLKSVIAGSNLLYAGEKQKSPLYIHSLITNSYIQSAYRFVGGSGQISSQLIKSIRSFGGFVLRNKKVVQLQMSDKKIAKAIVEDGSEYVAKSFISNVHPHATFEMLPQEVTRKIYFKRVGNLENTMSVFSLYITFKENCFKYIDYNIYHHRTKDVWVERDYNRKDWPLNFLFLTQVPKNGGEYAEGATVMSTMAYDEFEQWEGSEIENRPKEYDEFKERKQEQLLDFVEQRFPGIRNCIKAVYSSSPLSYRDYTATHRGSIYGVVRDYQSLAKSTIMPNTKVPNLFLTGQNTNLHGVLGVTVGSILTASKFVDFKQLLHKIKTA